MLSIDYIRKNTDKVRENILDRGLSLDKLEELLIVDKKRSELIESQSSINRRRNEIASILKNKKDDTLIEEGRSLKIQRDIIDKELNVIEEEYQNLLYWIPNIFQDEMPKGEGEEDNVEIYAWTPKDKELDKKLLGKNNKSKSHMPSMPINSKKDFILKDHIELGEMNDIIDIKQSAKVSGSRFSYIKKEGVILQWALASFLSQKLIKEGFYPINPPLLVKEKALFGTSHFPVDQDQVYQVDSSKIEDNNKLYLVGSSEPTNFSYFMDKILDSLPHKFFANTVCFRTEVGSWGKDVRGIKRVHQFDKLELAVVTHPDKSNDAFYELLDINKWFWESLEIPFHVILKCRKDSGYYASSLQADIETWLPSQKTFMEVGTCTNTTDYQARRLNIRYKDSNGKLQYAHTINDTGVALGRALITLIDNYQQEDGSIIIPSVLRPYTGFDIIKKN